MTALDPTGERGLTDTRHDESAAHTMGGPPAHRAAAGNAHPRAPGSPLEARSPVVAAVPRLALDVTQACAALGVSWDTWREHVEPSVRIVRIGRRKLVAVSELERWLERNAQPTLGRSR